MQPEVTYNQEKNGIEIRFAQKPGTPVRSELYNMGFRYHRGKKFWYAPVTEARIVFSKQLQQATDVTLEKQASFQPAKDNSDLQAAHWTEADEEYPVNKAIVHGVAYHQARLRKILLDRLTKLPLENQLAIVNKLRERFTERRSLETYDQSYITYGKKGSQRQIAIIGLYIDDIIIDHDLTKKNFHPVLNFLVNILTGGNTEVEQKLQTDSFPREDQPKSLQYELNRQIEDLIEEKDRNKIAYTEEDKNFISQYNDHAPERPGRIPDQVVQFIWKIAYKYGYKEGPVLNPSIGNGDLLRHAPKTATITGYESHAYAARIAQICYPFATINQQPFESIFFDENDNHLKDQYHAATFELVIGHPPVGKFSGMFAYMDEKEWTHADQYAEYCMTRGLDLLRPALPAGRRKGLLIFLMPSAFMQGLSTVVKEAIAEKSDLVDAFRIESLQSDVVVLRKKQSS